MKPVLILITMGSLWFGAPASVWAETSHVKVFRNLEGWGLKVNGEPTLIKGLSYTPNKVGSNPNTGTREDWMWADQNGNDRNDFAYDSFVDSNKNNQQDQNELTVGDFKLMQTMGVNTIRVYHHASNAPEVQGGYGTSAQQHLQYNHAPNKKLLRDLTNTYGIRVAMGDLLGAYTVGSGATWEEGTDYLDPIQKKRMRASVKQMVLDFKDEPFLLLYIIGNENNYEWTNTNATLHPAKYAQFVEEITQMIHSLDPNHPVAVSMGDTGMIDVLARYAPSVDIFGSNAYRQKGFETLWKEVADTYDKPVLFTEYGNLYAKFIESDLDEDHQKSIHEASWLDIEANTAGGSGQDNAIGGFALGWMDSWWQNGNPEEHNLATFDVHNEWHGIASQGDGTLSPYLRQLRQVYSTYEDLWKNKTLKPPENQVPLSDPDQPPIPQPPITQQPGFKNMFYPARGDVVTIGFTLREAASISVEINHSGNLVSTLLKSDLPAGNHSVSWDGRNNQGTLVSSGIYRYTIDNGDHIQTGKVLLLK